MNPYGEPLFLGWNQQTGRRVFIDRKERDTHVLALGRSGMGKSTHMEHQIRQDIREGRGVCVLDPEGELVPKLLAFCARRKSAWDRVVLIDPNDRKHSFGLNYFDIDGLEVQQKVDLFLTACYKVLGQSEKESRVLFDRWADSAAKPLVLYPGQPLTLAEFYPMLTDRLFRDAVLARLPDEQAPIAGTEWDYLERLRSQDQDFHLLAAIDRAVKFVRDADMRDMFGQASRISWRQAMDNGAIVLVNLHPTRVSSLVTHFLSVVLIHQIVEAGARRPLRPTPRPFYVYVDEFAELAAPDFARGIKRLRKRGCPLLLSQQELADFKIDDEGKLYAAARNSISVKLVYGLGNAEEAAIVAQDVFYNELARDEIKYQGPPVTNAIPIAKSGLVHSWSTAHTSNRGGGSGSTHGGGHADQTSASSAFGPGDEIVTTQGLMRGDQINWQESSSSSWGEADLDSETTSEAHWTEYEYELVPQTPVFRTPEELLNRYRAAIMSLDTGEAILKYHPKKPPVFLRTPAPNTRDFPEAWASEERMSELVAHSYARLGVLTTTEVRALIAQRQAAVLARFSPASLASSSSHAEVLDTSELEAHQRKPPAKRRS